MHIYTKCFIICESKESFKENWQVSQKFQITEQLVCAEDLLQRNVYDVFWTYVEDGIGFSAFSRL